MHDGKTAKVSVNTVRKHVCDECNSAFRQKHTLKEHKLSVHEGMRYACDQCEHVATVAGNLKKHKKLVHEDCKVATSTNLGKHNSEHGEAF